MILSSVLFLLEPAPNTRLYSPAYKTIEIDDNLQQISLDYSTERVYFIYILKLYRTGNTHQNKICITLIKRFGVLRVCHCTYTRYII